jgi:hypothetical protein
MFIEIPQDTGFFRVGYRLHNFNYQRSPKGIIRIARFERVFWPEINHGYYGDIYMKRFIRKWKQKTYKNIQRKKDRDIANKILRNKVCTDINNIIIDFL